MNSTDDTIRRIDQACAAHAERCIFTAMDASHRVHAAVYVVWADGTAYYLFGGSEIELRGSGAQMLALWEEYAAGVTPGASKSAPCLVFTAFDSGQDCEATGSTGHGHASV